MPSIQSAHVHFPALLEQPPVDRVRKVSLTRMAPCYVTYAYQTKKIITTASVGWSIQSWLSRKAGAIGCIRPTCSGVVERCQLPSPLRPSTQALRQEERSIFLLRYPAPSPIFPPSHHVLNFLRLGNRTLAALCPLSRPPLKPALPETGLFAFIRGRKYFDWFARGGKLSSDHHASSPLHFGLGFGGPLHANRCDSPMIEDGRPFVPLSRPSPVFLSTRTPPSSYSSGTSGTSRSSGNTSASVAFAVGA